jgi:hypothetical protein
MVKELIEAFGPVKSFDLVKDKETGNSKVRRCRSTLSNPP